MVSKVHDRKDLILSSPQKSSRYFILGAELINILFSTRGAMDKAVNIL